MKKSFFRSVALVAGFLTMGVCGLLAQSEKLDRGLVVAKGQGEGRYFASWRLLDTDEDAVTFTILRDGKPYLKDIGKTTSVAVSGTSKSCWQVVANHPKSKGQKRVAADSSKIVRPWENPYLRLKLELPTAISNEMGRQAYTANDCSVGDVDGDGQYELIVKWSAREADNSHDGLTPNVFLSCYKLDMENPDNATKCLWTVDLGKNIRAGAHYTQFMVCDFDGDGCAELMCKTAPGSRDGLGQYVNDAATDKEIREADNGKDWRNRRGRVSGGQEYLTVFSGVDGRAVHTVFYQPNRDTGIGGSADGTFDWSADGRRKFFVDNAEYGNRGERYLACVAYLDGMGEKPCAIFTRGYYTYAFAWAVSFDGKRLRTKWFHESRDGKQYSVTDADGKKRTYTAAKPTSGGGSGTLYGNGNHNLCVADVDGDGCDEMVWGAATLDNDGCMLYATGFGHGDAVHLADLNPEREGYEVFDVHENKGKYCWDVHDARTGEILLIGGPEGVDNGRGLAAQVDSSTNAYYFWSADAPEIRSAIDGSVVSRLRLPINFRIYWDGDLQDELLDGVSIHKWTAEGSKQLDMFGEGTLREYGNATSNNWTKRVPCLQCDLFGDWREEVICRDAEEPCVLYVYMSQIPTPYRMTTLMQDHLYRMCVAWQNVAYNQPPYLGLKKVR